MTEWLYEAGIGEARAALVADGAIVKARIEPEGRGPAVGTVAPAKLIEILIPRLSGRVRLTDGVEAMLDGLPAGLTVGATALVQIAREAIPEAGRPKLAKAVVAPEGALPGPGPDLLARITASGIPVRRRHAHQPDDLEAAGWSEVLEEAETGEIAFPGGALRMSVTPAMTLFDVDGSLPTDELARAGAAAVAAAVQRHGIGGSIGIDLPTMTNRAARMAAAAAFDAVLPQPFERTAVNGFGFLQIVRRRVRPSLPEMLRADPVAARTRAILRSLERTRTVTRTEKLPAAVLARLSAHPEWAAELARRTGVERTFEPIKNGGQEG